MDSIVVEDLERVDEDRLDDSHLPTSICNVAARIGTHEGRPKTVSVQLLRVRGT